MLNVARIALVALFFGISVTVHAQNVNGVLRVVKGDVKVKSGKTGETTKARLGGQVFPKDVIITGADSRAKVVMVDNNEINVSPDSQLEIQSYEFDPSKGKKDVLLNVIYGKVRAKVEQKYDGKTTKFQIKTPAAVAGVRGTDFVTSFDRQSQQTQIVTFEGKVEFGAPGPNNTIANAVMVAPGQTSTAAAGQAPSAPVAVPKEELNKVEKETKSEPSKDGAKDSAQKDPAADSKDKKDAKKEDGKSSDKQADKQDDKKGDKQPGDKQASDKQPGDKQDDKKGDKQPDRSADKQPDKQPDKQADKQPDKQPDRQGGSSASNGGTAGGTPRGPASVGGSMGGGASGSGGASSGASGGAPMTGAGPSAGMPPMGGGSMLRPEDFAGNAGAPTMPTMMDPTAGMGNMMPPTLMPGTMPTCDICNRLIENNNTKLSVTIKTQ